MKTKINFHTLYFFLLPILSFSQNEKVVLNIKDTSSFELIQVGKDTIYRITEISYEYDQFNFDDRRYLLKTKKIFLDYGGDHIDSKCDISIIDVNKPQTNLYQFSKECNQ